MTDEFTVSILGKFTVGMETFLNTLPAKGITRGILFTLPGVQMEEEAAEMESYKIQLNLVQDKTKFITTQSLAVALRDVDIVLIGHSFPITKKSLLAMKRFLKPIVGELKKMDFHPRFVFRDDIRGLVYGSLFIKLLEEEALLDKVDVLAISSTVYIGTRVFGAKEDSAALWPTINEDIVIQDGKNADKFKKEDIEVSEKTKGILEGRAVSEGIKILAWYEQEDDRTIDKFKIVGREPTETEARELDIRGGISFLPATPGDLPTDGCVRAAIKGLYDYTKESLSMINM